jgi:hypothetical protein
MTKKTPTFCDLAPDPDRGFHELESACSWAGCPDRYWADHRLLLELDDLCRGRFVSRDAAGAPSLAVRALDPDKVIELINQTARDRPGWLVAGDIGDDVFDRLDVHFAQVLDAGRALGAQQEVATERTAAANAAADVEIAARREADDRHLYGLEAA